MSERTTVGYKLRRAAAHPRRVVPYLQRLLRNRRLATHRADHIGFYRQVMADETAKDPDRAIGSDSRDSWLRVGQLQHDYLLRHGLRPEHRLLDVGCGNLRAGWRLMQYLERGHYYGIDISPDILLAAQNTIVEFGLQDRLPYLTVIRDLRLEFLPAGLFDVVTAHSVFTHAPLDVIDEALAHAGRLLAPGGFFDFTYFDTDGPPRDFLREDFYYPTARLLDLARSHGLAAERMSDWDYPQEKIRVTRS